MPMLGTYAWALMNGLIIGAVWIGIVLWNRQKRSDRHQARLEDEIARRQEELDAVNQRIAILEERLDFSERLMKPARQPDAQLNTPRN
jgi:uncharacterized membrane-anchored protein YhcB (DUF1043 family)